MSTIGRVLYAMRHQSFMQMWLVVVLLGSWVRPSLAQEALTKLLVAHAGLISTHASVWLAEDQGFYKKHGLDATSVFTGSGSVTSQALIAGEAKVASTSVGPTAGAVGAGADLMIVAGTIHIMPYQFWVLPQVRQPADLKGKRVAISTFGSGSHLAAESGAASSRFGSGSRQDRDHAGGNSGGSSSGACQRPGRCNCLWSPASGNRRGRRDLQ